MSLSHPSTLKTFAACVWSVFASRELLPSVFWSSESVALGSLEVVGEMANAVASMAGLRGASQVVLEGAFVISSSTRVPSRSNSSGRRVGASGKPGVVAVRAQQSEEGEISAQSRRSVLGLLAASVAASALVKEAQAAPTSIKIEGPPPLSGGLRTSWRCPSETHCLSLLPYYDSSLMVALFGDMEICAHVSGLESLHHADVYCSSGFCFWLSSCVWKRSH